jgi:hypothetical protein
MEVFIKFYLTRGESKVVNSVKSGRKRLKTCMDIITAIYIIPANCGQVIFKIIDIFTEKSLTVMNLGGTKGFGLEEEKKIGK